MRRTFRLLASVKPARYLEAGTPTGLTGMFTHPSPRSTLLFLYRSTLDKLKVIPEHSLYRQSVEALTKHRMAIVESTVPPGYEEWATKARQLLADSVKQVEKHEANAAESNAATDEKAPPGWNEWAAEVRKVLAKHEEDSNILLSASVRGDTAVREVRGDETFLIRHLPATVDEREQEWDGNFDPKSAGARERNERIAMRTMLERMLERKDLRKTLVQEPAWESEPQLTAEQISEIEHKIAAGLIEEVVQVAEGELMIVDTMVQANVWESLDEQPAEGQWVYFDRKV
ncbi:ETC complex I subunit conserved region-domain-containing protein [Lasiosphaeria hispida]|uniref:ETC complex I subunit conserved region-domain-containing protein n=1 Tax=Lasiosphaeria hispida TaxID=260671 RepID=A0AAJ0HH69_9PEZI|nr:ETC complex I subunit conserved region-domain-containing protein [Lasiosphaeria hispida]